MEAIIQDVLARWAYSEIVGARTSNKYDGSPGIDALRAKRNAGTLFVGLSALEREMLTQGWTDVRQFMLRFMNDVAGFRLIDLTKGQLKQLFVFPEVSHDLNRRFETFETFMILPRTDMGDPRGETRPYQVCADPLTIGRHCKKKVLIDGYHRAVSFWKSAPEGAVIAAYDPVL
jgi:hypothetical protein